MNIDENQKLSVPKLSKLFKSVMKISVEPLLLVSLFVIVMYSIVSQQFIYHQISIKYGLNYTNKTSACKSDSLSNETKILLSKVSSETSSWILYLNIAGFIPSFFCTVIIGAWGDVVGRKPVLLLGFSGLLLMIGVYLLVVQLNLNVAFLLVARILAGLSGDFNSILASCYAYLCDVSSHEKRTLRIAIGEACTGIGGLLASIVSSVWIESQMFVSQLTKFTYTFSKWELGQLLDKDLPYVLRLYLPSFGKSSSIQRRSLLVGFTPPLWLLLSLLIASIIYIALILNESKSILSNQDILWKAKIRALFSCRPFFSLKGFINENREHAFKVLGIAFCFFLQLVVHDGVGDTVIVYELSPPLCWTSLLIGLGSAIRDSAYLFGVAFLKILSSRFSDFSYILISSISSTTGLVFYAFAFSTWIMFVGYSFSVLRTVSATVLRSMVSRLVGKAHQGSGFAIIACAESLSSLIASFLFNGVYSATVNHVRGAVFLMGAGLQVLFTLLSWLVYRKTKHDLVSALDEEHRILSASSSVESIHADG